METKERAEAKGLDSGLDFLGQLKPVEATEDIHFLRRAFFQRHLDKGIKGKNLAKHCGISPSMLTMILKGERNIGSAAQRKIEAQLGLKPGLFSSPAFLKETLLCDFSNFEFTPFLALNSNSRLNASPAAASASVTVKQATALKPEKTTETPEHEAQMLDASDFDLSSLNQMVKLSRCAVSVETVGVKGNELTLMVKLKF